MNRQFWKNTLGWGFALWFIGYALGIVLFAILPPALIGWAILPVGIVITVWVLLRRVKVELLWHYLVVSIAWTAIAVIGDYLFIVKLFAPPDGYYKRDVYLYYALTFTLPLAVGSTRPPVLHASEPR